MWLDIDTIFLKNLDSDWNDFILSNKKVSLSICELKSSIPNVCIHYLMAKKQCNISNMVFGMRKNN